MKIRLECKRDEILKYYIHNLFVDACFETSTKNVTF